MSRVQMCFLAACFQRGFVFVVLHCETTCRQYISCMKKFKTITFWYMYKKEEVFKIHVRLFLFSCSHVVLLVIHKVFQDAFICISINCSQILEWTCLLTTSWITINVHILTKINFIWCKNLFRKIWILISITFSCCLTDNTVFDYGFLAKCPRCVTVSSLQDPGLPSVLRQLPHASMYSLRREHLIEESKEHKIVLFKMWGSKVYD